MTNVEQKQNQEQQGQRRQKDECIATLEGVQVFFYISQESIPRYGRPRVVEKVLADANMKIGDSTVPVTVYPSKFIPTIWSPDQPLSERKFYTVDIRVLEGRRGFYGYAEPSKGTVLLDSERIAIQRLEGVVMDRLAFKVRGKWGDGSPKFVAYCRKYGNRPVVLDYGLKVNEDEIVTVALTERRNPRPNDTALIGKLMVVRQQADRPIGYTVDLETPTGELKKGIREATHVNDYVTTRTKVGIYQMLTFKQLGIVTTEETRAAELDRSVNRLLGYFLNRIESEPVLIKRCALMGMSDAIDAAGNKALQIAIAKHGDDRKTETAQAASAEPVQPSEATAETAPSATAQETAPVEADQERDTVIPPAPPVFEEETSTMQATAAETAVEAPKVAMDERIVKAAADLKEDAAVVEKAFVKAVEQASARGQSLTLEAFLGQNERVLRFAIRAAKAAK